METVRNMTLQTLNTVLILRVTGVCKCTTTNRVKRSLLTTRGVAQILTISE